MILSEDHRLPLVGVDLWYHVGPVHEAPGRTGFAHLFEHMMFQGSKHVPGDAHFTFARRAPAPQVSTARRISIGRTTSRPCRRISWSWHCGSSRIAWAICSRRSTRRSCRTSRTSSATSGGKATRIGPTALSTKRCSRLSFRRASVSRQSSSARTPTSRRRSSKTCRQFFKQYYAPNNATLAIAGDIDKAAAKKLVEKYFGTLKRGPAIPPLKVDHAADHHRAPASSSQDRIELPRVYMAWITPAYFKDGDADADVAAACLATGRSSRLYKKLVYEKQIAQNVTAYQYSLMLGSMFGIEATARPGRTLQELEAAIDEELALLRTEGPTGPRSIGCANVFETRMFSGLQLVEVSAASPTC